MRAAFEEKLRRLINCESMENPSGTPDFILADFLLGALDAYNKAVERREDWYGRAAMWTRIAAPLSTVTGPVTDPKERP